MHFKHREVHFERRRLFGFPTKERYVLSENRVDSVLDRNQSNHPGPRRYGRIRRLSLQQDPLARVFTRRSVIERKIRFVMTVDRDLSSTHGQTQIILVPLVRQEKGADRVNDVFLRESAGDGERLSQS